MNSFISFFKKAPAFGWLLTVAVLFETGLHFAGDLYYIDGRGAFLTSYKRAVAEDPQRVYDYLIFGDSRSMSINGRKDELYNFSLPAAGPRYFSFFLKKYLSSHQEKPRVVVWATDALQLAGRQNVMYHDSPEIWKQFKHRLLNLFSIKENWEQYEGEELVFIMKESLPNLLLSVKHREGFEHILTATKASDLRDLKLGHVRENIKLVEHLEELNGQINVGNYFNAPDFVTLELSKKSLKQQIDHRKVKHHTMKPVLDFIEEAEKNGIKVVILEMPLLTGLSATEYNRTISRRLEEIAGRYQGVKYLKFPVMDYSPEYFSEGIHYNRKGENRMNGDFDRYVWPEIVKFGEGK